MVSKSNVSIKTRRRMNFREFLKTKIFLRQAAYAVLFVLVLLWIVFKIMNVYTRDDECINCVLEQKIKGTEIKPGTLVDKGTRIDLVIGKGKNNSDAASPL